MANPHYTVSMYHNILLIIFNVSKPYLAQKQVTLPMVLEKQLKLLNSIKLGYEKL